MLVTGHLHDHSTADGAGTASSIMGEGQGHPESATRREARNTDTDPHTHPW